MAQRNRNINRRSCHVFLADFKQNCTGDRGLSFRVKAQPVVQRLLLAALLVPILCLSGGRLYAQSATTAEVVGTVQDQTGSIIPGAQITIVNTGTNASRKTISNAAGAFVFDLLKPGTYRLDVTMTNFKRYVVPPFTLAAGDQPRINVAMSVGAVSQTVEVQAATPLLQSESSTMQSSIPQVAVQNLPLNGRNFVQLVQLAPGANEGPPGSLTAGTGKDDERGAASVSADGQSDLLNNQMVDGMDNNEGLIGSIRRAPLD